MTSFWVVMTKRKDGKIFADLHKTNGKIYLTKEEAESALQERTEEEQIFWHVVELAAEVPDGQPC